MPVTLLKPHIFGLKNRIYKEFKKHFLFSRDVAVIVLAFLAMFGIYRGTFGFLTVIREHPSYDPLLPTRLLAISFLAFFFLLLFSNSIAALGYLFSSKDLPLLLTLPIRKSRLFAARLLEVMLTSSWMFMLFSVPALFGFAHGLELHWSFLGTSLLLLLPFMLIPASLGVIFVVIFVNVVSPSRIRDLLVILAFMLVMLILYLNSGSEAYVSTEEEKLNHLVRFLYLTEDPQPLWSPAKWYTLSLAGYLNAQEQPVWLPALMLISAAAAAVSLAYLFFDAFFFRGWSIASNAQRKSRVAYSGGIAESIGYLILPFCPQFRAIFLKEGKTFIRDTVQSLQLLMLLMLTFIYLYNFRALRVVSQFDEEGLAWWQVVLSVSNIAFGACVVSAIATRFVFPSISLEGRAYALLRSTPLSIRQLLSNKFYTWLLPMSVLSVILLVSGSLALQAPIATVIATAGVALALSISITGLAVGIGGVYARFDWDSPAEVTANFGSLVFMLLSLGTIAIVLIPCGFMFVLTTVPGFTAQMSSEDYRIALLCSYVLVFYINYAIARRALNAGAQRLRDLER